MICGKPFGEESNHEKYSYLEFFCLNVYDARMNGKKQFPFVCELIL
tara:strand:+ start:6 stop:143 length:138 start_codon:yes stop_codon:yes gene_type:complete